MAVSDAWSVALEGWHFHWTVVLGTVLILGGYLAAIGPLRKRFPGSEGGAPQAKWFILGVLIIFFALVSPLDELSDRYLLSAHMIQHILFTLVGAPLMVFGVPGWLLRSALRKSALAAVARFLTKPFVAYALFNGFFVGWHAPALYEAALENETVHAVAHLTFLATAVLAWWPILSPLPELPRLPYPGQVLFLFLQSFPSTLLGAFITFAPAPLYSTYATAPRMFGMSAMSDQALAGLIMWMPGGMIYLVALVTVFFKWVRRDEQPYDGRVV